MPGQEGTRDAIITAFWRPYGPGPLPINLGRPDPQDKQWGQASGAMYSKSNLCYRVWVGCSSGDNPQEFHESHAIVTPLAESVLHMSFRETIKVWSASEARTNVPSIESRDDARCLTKNQIKAWLRSWQMTKQALLTEVDSVLDTLHGWQQQEVRPDAPLPDSQVPNISNAVKRFSGMAHVDSLPGYCPTVTSLEEIDVYRIYSNERKEFGTP